MANYSDEVIEQANQELYQDLDPTTNLPQDVDLSSLSAEDYALPDEVVEKSEYDARNLRSTVNRGTEWTDPSEYDFDMKLDTSNDYIRAERQSGWGMVGKAGARLALTTLTKLGASAGYAANSLPALLTWDMDKMLNNSFSEAMNEYEEEIKEALPIYKTRAYDSENLLTQMVTLGFWTDDVVDGAAFAMSSMLGSYGMNAVLNGVGKYVSISKQLAKATTASRKGADVGNTMFKLGKMSALKDKAAMIGFQTVGEAAFEAKDLKDTLLESFANDIETGRMTEEDANLKASQAARTAFWSNVAVLLPSNALSTDMMFKGFKKYNMQKAFKSELAKGRTLKEAADALGEGAEILTKKELAGAYAKNIGASMVSEGIWEENMQLAIQNYAEAKAHDLTDDDIVSGIFQNWQDNFSTFEGRKSMALGAIIGTIFGTVGAKGEVKNKKAQEANAIAAQGMLMESLTKDNVQDIYVHQTVKDENGKEKEIDAIVIKDGKPVIDNNKLASIFTQAYDKYTDFVTSVQSLAAGNEHMYEFVRHNQFANLFLETVMKGGDTDTFNGLIQKYAEMEVESLARTKDKAGEELTESEQQEVEQETQELVSKYSELATEFGKIYDSILNNYGGLLELGNGIQDQAVKQGYIGKQYQVAAQQLYLNNLVKDLEQTIKESENIKGSQIEGVESLKDSEVQEKQEEAKKAAKALPGVREALKDNRAELKELLNTKKIEKDYANTKRLIREQSEGRDVADTTVNDENDASDERSANNKNNTTVDVEGVDGTNINSLTPEEAVKQGYTEDKDRSKVVNADTGAKGPSYYYKTDPENGHVAIAYTDGTDAANVIGKRDLFGIASTDPITGNESRATVNFLNDRLTGVTVMDLDTGNMRHVPASEAFEALGREDLTPKDIQEITDNIETIAGVDSKASVKLAPDHSDVSVDGYHTFKPISRDIIADNLANKIEDPTSEIVSEIQAEKEIIVDMIKDGTIEFDVKEASLRHDSRFDGKKLHGVFENDNGSTVLEVIYNDKVGSLYLDGNKVVFKSHTGEDIVTVDKKSSRRKFKNAGIKVLSDTMATIEYRSATNKTHPLYINDVAYAPVDITNPLESITYDNNQVPTSVTLVDEAGKKHVFTSPFVVIDLAYSLGVRSLVQEQVIYRLTNLSDSKLIKFKDYKTGADLFMYRKEGALVVFRRSPQGGKITRVPGQSPIYRRALESLYDAVNQITDTAVENINNPNPIEDGINETETVIEQPTTEEANNIPFEEEVQPDKPGDQPTTEQEVAGTEEAKEVEAEIIDDTAEKVAQESVVETKIDEAQKEALNELESSLPANLASPEVIDADEIPNNNIKNPEEEALFGGVHDLSEALAYVHRETLPDGTKESAPKNTEFHEHILNNDMSNSVVEVAIDFDSNDYVKEFWDEHPRLKGAIQSGTMLPEHLEKTLDTEEKNKTYRDEFLSDFNTLADVIPLKVEVRDLGFDFKGNMHVHTPHYKHMSTPPDVTKGLLDPADIAKAIAQYQKDQRLKLRGNRKQMLRALMLGGKVEMGVTDQPKSKGTINSTANQQPIGNIISTVGISPSMQDIIVSNSDGRIKIKSGDTIAAFTTKSIGGVYWYTNLTANGTKIPIKVNPVKVSREHAEILLKAFRQLANGTTSTKYKGSEVKGDLTIGEVLNEITTNGKKYTEVTDAEKSIRGHLIDKQLWFDGKNTIHYGDGNVLTVTTKHEGAIEAFLKWVTENKNYKIDRSKLNTAPKKAFEIGSLKYDPTTQNYTAYVIKNNLLTTNAELVAGTESLTKNPVFAMDVDNMVTSIPDNKVKAEPKPVEGKIEPAPQPIEDKPKPIEVKQAEVSGVVIGDMVDGVKSFEFEGVNVDLVVIEGAFGDAYEIQTQATDLEALGKDLGKLIGVENALPTDPETGAYLKSPLDEDVAEKLVALDKLEEAAPKAVETKEVEPLVEDFTIPEEESDDVVTVKEPVEEDDIDDWDDVEVDEETQARIDKNVDSGNISDITGVRNRMVEGTTRSLQPYSTSKASKWLRKKLGNNFDINIVEGLIELANDRHAFGQARVDSITLSDAAEEGTEYHEAFHRVSLFLLTTDQRDSVYADARKSYPETKDMTNDQVEEFLAEKFRDYVMETEAELPTTVKGKIKKFFKDIYDYIMNVFVGPGSLTDLSVESLFNKIEDGRFKYQQMPESKIRRLQGKYANFEVRGYRFQTIDSDTKYRETLQYLFYLMADAGGLMGKNATTGELELKLSNIESLENLSFEALKDKIVETGKLYQQASRSEKYNPEIRQAFANGAKTLLEVYKKRDVIKPDLVDYMQSLNIKIKEESLEVDEETGENLNNVDAFGKASFESSAKHSTTSNIKMLLSMLPLDNKLSDNTGFPRFADFGPLWSKVINQMQGITNHQDMMDRLEEFSKGDAPIRSLYNRIKNDYPLSAQLYNEFSLARLDFITGYVNKLDRYIRLHFANSAVNQTSKSLLKTWQSNFNLSEELFISEKGKSIKKNEQAYLNLRNQWLTLLDGASKEMTNDSKLSSYDIFLNEAALLTNKLGIDMTASQLEEYLSSINDNKDIALFEYIDGNKGLASLYGKTSSFYGYFVTDNVDNPVANEGAIKDMAEYMSEYDDESRRDSILAAEGNEYYLMTAHTTLTNMIDEYKKNPNETLGDRLTAAYNTNSVWLNHLMDNPEALDGLSLKTFAMLLRENYSDNGREYQKISDLEEYVVRMSANADGLLAPPTPGDRKFYQYIPGMPTVKLAIDENQNLLPHVTSDLNPIDTFIGYLEDEQRRVDLTRRQVEDALTLNPQDIAIEDLVENLHFKFQGGRAVEAGQTVLATNENHEWYIVPVGQKAPHGNGKLIKEDGKYVGRGANFVLFTDAETNSLAKSDPAKYVENLLHLRIENELNVADRLGVIEYKGDVIIDKMLPAHVMEDTYTRLGTKDASLVAYNMIAENAINTMMANIEFQKTFSSDFASFKGSDDYVKRITGLTSTGKNLMTDYKQGVWDNDALITSNQYNSTVFTSHLIESEMYDQLLAFNIEFYENLKTQDGIPAYTKSRARQVATEKVADLKKIDQTDAQTFITYEMYRALSVKLGEWSDAKERLYKLISGGKPLSRKDALEASKLITQPLKLTYMKPVVENGQTYSVFDKMSLATLFRIEYENKDGHIKGVFDGTQLEEVINRMELKGKYNKRNYPGIQPIHQLKFSTAQKEGMKDRRNLFSDESEQSFTDLSKLQVYQQDFKSLRKQLVTDPHDNATISLASQFKKIGFSNVYPNAEYQNMFDKTEREMKGETIVKEINDAISLLSTMGLESFKEEYALDDNFNVTDKQKLLNKLKDEGKKSDMANYVMEALKTDENGDYYVDFDAMPGFSNWIQSKLLSGLKKATIDLNLPGNSFIQMSNIGLRKIDKSDDLKWNTESGFIEAKVSVSLFKDIVPNYKNKTHGEIVKFLKQNPELVAMGYRVPVQGQNSTYALEIVDFLPENNGDTIVLPAEGPGVGGYDYDIDKMYVVRHNYDNKVNRIKYLHSDNSTVEERMRAVAKDELKKEISDVKKKHQTEDDLSVEDADFVNKEAAKMAKEEIDLLIEDWIENNKNVFATRPMMRQNSEKAIQNRLLDMYFSIWLSDHHKSHREQPLGYGAGKLKDLAGQVVASEGVVEIDKVPLGFTTPSYQLETKSKLKFGGEGIGPNALNNVHHILGQSVDLGLFVDLGVGNTHDVEITIDQTTSNIEGDRATELREAEEAWSQNVDEQGFPKESLQPILQAINDKYDSLELGETGPTTGDQPVTTTENVTMTSLSGIIGKDGEFITEWFSALVDAHVDIAADPYIYNLNAGDYTNPVIALMIRAGIGGENTFKFIAQPILKEMAKSQENKGNVFDLDVTKDINKIKEEYVSKYLQLSGASEINLLTRKRALNKALSSPAKLMDNIKALGDSKQPGGEPLKAEYYYNQLVAYEAFKYLQPFGNQLRDAVLASRVDVKKTGNSISEIVQYNSLVDKALINTANEDGIRNFDKLMSDTYLGEQTENAVNSASRLIEPLLLEGSQAFGNIRDMLIAQTGAQYSSNLDMIRGIVSEIKVEIAGRYMADAIGKDAVSTLLYGNNSIPNKIHEARAGKYGKDVANNPLINLLRPIFEQGDKALAFLYVSKPDDKFHKDSIVRGWSELLSNDNTKGLAIDLFKYSYLTSGFKNGIYSFFDLAPIEIYRELGYDKYMKQLKSKLVADPNYFNDMMDDIYLSGWNNNDLVPKVNGDDLILQPWYNVENYNESIILVNSDVMEGGRFKYLTGEYGEVDGNIIPAGRPYIKNSVFDRDSNSYKTTLYKYAGVDVDTNNLIYTAVNKKGYSNRGYVVRENGFKESSFSSNKPHTPNRENLTKILEVLGLTTALTVNETIVPKTKYDYQENSDSDQISKALSVKSITRNNKVSQSDMTLLEGGSYKASLENHNIPSGFYTLDNGNIVDLTNNGDGTYWIEQYGTQMPSMAQVMEKRNECK